MKINKNIGEICILFFLLATTVFGQVPPEIPNRMTFDEFKVEIVDLIKELQAEHVKNSINEYNCFTRDDYEEFTSTKVVEKITEKLKKDEYFLDLVKSASQLTSLERRKILREAKNTYERTWAEIGKISPDGQTDEGSKAEKEIAVAITKLLEDLMNAS